MQMKFPALDEIDQELARRSLLEFTQHTMPTYSTNWHHAVMCRYLDRFIAGDIRRLMIFAPPRHGKSEVVSRRLPAHIFGLDPDATIIAASYGADLARRMNRDVQRIMDDDKYHKLFPRSQLFGKNIRTVAQGSWLRNSDMFEIVGRRGYYLSSGVGGSLTGSGASCLTGETLIRTEIGDIAISTLFVLQYHPKVWAFDHASNMPVLRRIVATQESTSNDILEIVTVSGRRISATAGHRFYVQGRGYQAAALLHPGDRFQTFTVEQDLLGVRRGKKGRKPWGDVLGVLSKDASDQGAPGVHPLRQGIRPQIIRTRKGIEEGADRRLLQCGVLVRPQQRKERTGGASPVSILRKDDLSTEDGSFLFAGMQDRSEATAGAAGSHLPILRGYVFTQDKSNAVLFKFLRRRGALGEDARRRELAFQDRNQLREMVYGDATIGYGQGRTPLRYLSAGGRNLPSDLARTNGKSNESEGPSRERRPNEQHPRKPCHPLPEVPCSAPPLKYDTVAVVRHLRSGEIPVYDIQVEGCNNFFAGDVLVHNCAIIDDPVKNRAEANSATYRENVWDWYTSTLRTRLTPDGGVLLTCTRWHQDDLAGRLLALAASDPGADQWVVVRFPAIAEEPVADYDTRRAGQALWPTKFNEEKLERTRISLGTYDWNSLYQQRPAPREGGMFKRAWFDIVGAAPKMAMRVRYWDKAGSTSKGSDYTAGVLMARDSDGVFYVENVVHGRYSALERERIIRQTAETDKAQFGNVAIWLEQEPGSGGKESAEASVRSLAGFNVHKETVSGDKETRAAPFAAQCEARNVKLVQGAWNAGYLDELTAFPNAAHDDQVDGSSGGFNKLVVQITSLVDFAGTADEE